MDGRDDKSYMKPQKVGTSRITRVLLPPRVVRLGDSHSNENLALWFLFTLVAQHRPTLRIVRQIHFAVGNSCKLVFVLSSRSRYATTHGNPRFRICRFVTGPSWRIEAHFRGSPRKDDVLLPLLPLALVGTPSRNVAIVTLGAMGPSQRQSHLGLGTDQGVYW